MFLNKIEIGRYKILEDIQIHFEQKKGHQVFPIISINGGGKSSLLQVIFAFLHCAFDNRRHTYLKTIIKGFDINSDYLSLIRLEFSHANKNYFLEFISCKDGYNDYNFESIITEAQVISRKNNNNEHYQNLELLNKIETDLLNSNIPTSLAVNELRHLASTKREEALFERRSTLTSDQLFSLIKTFRRRIERTIDDGKVLDDLLLQASTEKNKLLSLLSKNKLNYAFHFNNNQNALLYQTNASIDLLITLSNRVYLATPITQVLHFLEDEKLSHLFKKERYFYSSYESTVRECQKDLKGLFNYDFSTINLILEAFKKARDDDFKLALDTGEYGNHIKSTQSELKEMFSGKSISIDSDFKGVSFRLDNNKSLTPKDLSHGELKKLSIYIWLKAITEDDSIVLMDEVDMGLHPSWQYEVYSDLQNWNKGSQFILATHSPQIISRSLFKNLVVLKDTKTGATSEQFSEAPLESDLNTIVKTIMGGEYLPKELIDLRKKYRQLFEEGKIESKQAKDIKKKILMYESENSSFFQDINFQMQFNV